MAESTGIFGENGRKSMWLQKISLIIGHNRKKDASYTLLPFLIPALCVIMVKSNPMKGGLYER